MAKISHPTPKPDRHGFLPAVAHAGRGRPAGTLKVGRVQIGGPRAFFACLVLGGEATSDIPGRERPLCAQGPNPRIAVARALDFASKSIRGRGGVFAGMGRR